MASPLPEASRARATLLRVSGPELDLLVAAARAGGGWAFGRLWEQLSPTVHAYVRGLGVRDPDDTTSEVFLAAFRRIEQFDGDGRAFKSWLFTIAHHKVVDSWRRGTAVREVPTDRLDDRRTAPSAEDAALDRLSGGTVHELLATLTGDQRSVLLLRVLGELSLEETARVVGKPVGAVKSLQHRALQRLRRRMIDEAVSPGSSEAIAGST
jgi:RNA polymerase sigma-70 factor (ECF subfamily)